LTRDIALGVTVAELGVIALLLVRLARGPSVGDRIVAANTISTQTAIITLFYAAYADRVIYLDVAIWMVSFSYLAALVWSRYLERGLL
jgi:multicomponent Na+:H+ antiporter subunit F